MPSQSVDDGLSTPIVPTGTGAEYPVDSDPFRNYDARPKSVPRMRHQQCDAQNVAEQVLQERQRSLTVDLIWKRGKVDIEPRKPIQVTEDKTVLVVNLY